MSSAAAAAGSIRRLDVHASRWEPRVLSAARVPAAGRWLILGDAGGVGRRLAGALESHGIATTVVHADAGLNDGHGVDPLDPAAFDDLVARQTDLGTLAGVVDLWTLDAGAVADTSAASIALGESAGVGAVLHLIQALARHSQSAQLWVVTRGAQAVEDHEAPAVAQSPVWGLGRVIALDQPESWGGLIDLDPDATVPDVNGILSELGSVDGEDQVAFRSGRRLVPRLRRTAPVGATLPHFDPEATYLITGGVGALGRRVAHWMVRNGATDVILTALHALPTRDRMESAAP